MSNRLEAYLNDVEGYLSSLPANIREGERREISGHLQQLTDDLRAADHNEEDAASLAIARFGAARSVGLRLRDVWEGNRGLLVTLLAVMGSNLLLSLVHILSYIFILIVTRTADGAYNAAIAPAFVACGLTTLLGFPFIGNFVLGRWGGRCILAEVLLAYLLLEFFLPYNIAPHSELAYTEISFAGSFSPASEVFSLGFHYIYAIMGCAAAVGAWHGATSRRRQRWATIGNVPFEQAAVLLAKPRRLRLLPLARRLLILGSIGILAFWMIKQRIYAARHPQTPEAAVRVLLSDPGMNFNEMAPATNVSLQLLPPTTAAEQAGIERCVAYSATMHATEAYRQQRIVWMQRELRTAREGHPDLCTEQDARAAIARLRPEGYTIRGVLRVKKTPFGWKVNDSTEQDSNQESHLWAWLYDLGYQEPPAKP